MTLPSPNITCNAIDLDLDGLLYAIQLPGGVGLDIPLETGSIPDAANMVQKLLTQLIVALLPLVPFFRILDVVLALVECFKAIPDALGPPPDPTKLTNCVNKLLKAVSQLGSLVPQLTIPVMVKTALDVCILFLRVLRYQLEQLLTVQARLGIAQERIDALALDPDLLVGSVNLQVAFDCASGNFVVQSEATMRSVCGLNKLFALINLFLSLIQLPAIADVEFGDDPEDALVLIDDAIALLEKLRDSIPAIPTIQPCL